MKQDPKLRHAAELLVGAQASVQAALRLLGEAQTAKKEEPELPAMAGRRHASTAPAGRTPAGDESATTSDQE